MARGCAIISLGVETVPGSGLVVPPHVIPGGGLLVSGLLLESNPET